ncbi:MAG: adenosylcobinamide amidohydrolase [Halomonas sp.]|uniref:adenosylcobinamide amidohydrolase n=1 Tax=Halomonas sp. TaxID=1486246 RepID=UPI003F8E7FF1
MKQDSTVNIRSLDFGSGLTLRSDAGCAWFESALPLRTLSSAMVGQGLGWHRHFCHFHVDKDYAGCCPEHDLRGWLGEREIPDREAIALMTAVPLGRLAIECAQAGERRVLVAATAGVGNAVDITAPGDNDERLVAGTINLMVLVDGHLEDAALVNACLSATEAKVRALSDAGVQDVTTGTQATGTSTDAIIIAATQRGEPTPYAGSGTLLGRAIGYCIYTVILRSLECAQPKNRGDDD